MAYRFIEKYHDIFGVRWLLKRLSIHPNAYYNYLKKRKEDYLNKKEHIHQTITKIYHAHKGIPGYRMMRFYLKNEGIILSKLTVHKYMNQQLNLKSITRKRKPNYKYGEAHKTFDNILNQNFSADKINIKWCTDFTYLFLESGSKRYNCTIIDLHDRSVVASITDDKITSALAIRTINEAFSRQGITKADGIILHSDQGSQFTSKEFTDFCDGAGITQSMSKAGYPYDNAPMERYFNTLKSELIYQHEYKTEEELYSAISRYAYEEYNMKRPHTYNNGNTPFQARYSA